MKDYRPDLARAGTMTIASAPEQLFLTEEEAARVLRVHPSTLGRLVKAGRSPIQPIYAGSRRIYSMASLRALSTAASRS